MYVEMIARQSALSYSLARICYYYFNRYTTTMVFVVWKPFGKNNEKKNLHHNIITITAVTTSRFFTPLTCTHKLYYNIYYT